MGNQARGSKKFKGCSTKRRYRSRGEANGAAKSHRRQGKGQVRAYPCSECKGWHLSSKGAESYQRSQKKKRARKKRGS